MRCEDYKKLIYDLVDGTLDEARARYVRAHTDQCPECRRQLRSWERLRAGFSAIPRPAMPRSLAAEVVYAASRQRVPFWARLGPAPALRVAAVCGVLLLAAAGALVIPSLRGPGGGDDLTSVARIAPGAPQRTFEEVLPDVDVPGREHALFARAGTAFDRNLWTVAVNLESLSLLE